MTGAHRLAAIDIGTVTTRLLVADVSGDTVHEIDRSTDITHLGSGLAESGTLSDEAMQRVSGVVSRYSTRMKDLGVESHRAVATSASRDAENGDVFLAMLEEHGVRPSIIEGSEEARLSFLGATSQIQGSGILVVDCGGGSTELVCGDVEEGDEGRTSRITAARSVDVGSRRMTDLFLHSDPPARTELDSARAWAADEMRGYFDRLEARPREMVAVAGTATSLAAIRQQLAVYDTRAVHGYRLNGSDLADLLDMLSAMPLERRREVVGLHPERAGVIVAGAVILETVLALAGLDSMVVSEHDILYGILIDTYRDLQESVL